MFSVSSACEPPFHQATPCVQCAVVGDGGALEENDAGASDAGLDAGSSCVLRQCSDVSAVCGLVADGCGGKVLCGLCGEGEVCGAVSANQCCRPKTCSDLGAQCGVNLPDGCGGFIASCGSQPTCGFGDAWSCDALTLACTCTPKTCKSAGYNCGVEIPDGCGGIIKSCGKEAGTCLGTDEYCDPHRWTCVVKE